MTSLVILRGLPGSGKSYRAKNEFADYLHYEPDHLFCDSSGRYRYDHQLWDEAVHWILMLTDFALARGENVVVSDVFPTVKSIQPFVDTALHHEAEVFIYTCHGNYGNCHQIPLTILNRMRQTFEEIKDGQVTDWVI